MFFSSYCWSKAETPPSFVSTANSATSSSATSLYVVFPFCSTFSHTFMLKWRSPLSPALPPCVLCMRFFLAAGSPAALSVLCSPSGTCGPVYDMCT